MIDSLLECLRCLLRIRMLLQDIIRHTLQSLVLQSLLTLNPQAPILDFSQMRHPCIHMLGYLRMVVLDRQIEIRQRSHFLLQ